MTVLSDENGTATLKYDANGNVSEKQSATGEVTTYTYDGENRLIQEVSNWGKSINYYYDALGNRIGKATSSDERKLKTNLMEWMKGVDRTSQLSLSTKDITLAEALGLTGKGYEGKYAKELVCGKPKTWVVDRKESRRKATETKLKKPLEDKQNLEIIRSLNDYTQEYVSPLQIELTTASKYKAQTTTATEFYNAKGTNIGDDLDYRHHLNHRHVLCSVYNQAYIS